MFHQHKSQLLKLFTSSGVILSGQVSDADALISGGVESV